MLPIVLCLLSIAPPDTLRIAPAARRPLLDGAADSLEYGAPSILIASARGAVRVWLRRWHDTVYLAASIPDFTPSSRDAFAISLDRAGTRSAAPDHDDFQWDIRRVADSSVIYRGRDGRWQPPLDDPDWRLGAERSGGGWELATRNDAAGWSVEMRFDPAYFSGEGGRAPGIAFRIFDDDPSDWAVWPLAPELKHPSELEQRPALWAVVRP